MGEMKHAAHTPGPWQLEGNWQDNDRKVGGWVSTMHPSPVFELNPVVGEKSEIIANARLIAAAPDLLAAIKALLHQHDNIADANIWRQMREYGVAVDAAVAALSKAEGRSLSSASGQEGGE